LTLTLDYYSQPRANGLLFCPVDNHIATGPGERGWGNTDREIADLRRLEIQDSHPFMILRNAELVAAPTFLVRAATSEARPTHIRKQGA
jgi:hypothetical protein